MSNERNYWRSQLRQAKEDYRAEKDGIKRLVLFVAISLIQQKINELKPNHKSDGNITESI